MKGVAGLSLRTRPDLREPIMLAAFHGWNDGGSAATLAATFVRTTLDAVHFATIDPEDYVDFKQVRPHVSLPDGVTREISWPETEFFHAALPGKDRDVVICIGVEPNIRWRSFSAEMLELAQTVRVDLAIMLGGLIADTPHTRPVPVHGAAGDDEVASRLGLPRSRYEGPTGIVGVLHDAFQRGGLPSASLWAAVPHYVAPNANPPAALALVRNLERLLEVQFDPSELEEASAQFNRQIAEVLESDEDTASYVRDLERRLDSGEELDPPEMPSGDDIARDFQRFLREHRDDEPGA
jgi:proteasome assembly chaperone (PAC2) family protein